MITLGDETGSSRDSEKSHPRGESRRFDVVAPSWLDGLTWWHVYPLGFSGAEPEPTRPTASSTGCATWRTGWTTPATSALAACSSGPVFASQTHGYDTTDHLHIDHRLGDEQDFDAPRRAAATTGACACSSTGCSTTSAYGHPMFQVARAAGPHPTGRRRPGGAVVPPATGPTATASPTYDVFEGHGSLVTLNHEEPGGHRLRGRTSWTTGSTAGADGWRLDAAYAVAARRSGARSSAGSATGTPTPGSSARYIHGEPDRGPGASRPRRGHRLRPVAPAVALAERRQLLRPHLAGRAPGRRTPPSTRPMTFVGNHDVTRIASNLRRPAPLRPRDRRAVHAARLPVDLLRRRAGVPRDQGGAVRRRRRRPADVPGPPRGPGPLGVADLPPAPAADRDAPRHPWLTRSQPTVAHVTNTVDGAAGHARRRARPTHHRRC